MKPKISIITVVKNDAWALSKTIRSIFEQGFGLVEYIVIDGNSTDGTKDLINFWHVNGLINTFISENDSGVYDAMNKGVELANGEYVTFLNAGDVYVNNQIIRNILNILESDDVDGILGWGKLGREYWISWAESAAIKMSSLGFCHQALFIKRETIKKEKFVTDNKKTDADTLQLGRLYEKGFKIKIIKDLIAIRSESAGISSDYSVTKKSVLQTIVSDYGLSQNEAESIIEFRRYCKSSNEIIKLLNQDNLINEVKEHISLMVLDTLSLERSFVLNWQEVINLVNASIKNIRRRDLIDGYIEANKIRIQLLETDQENIKIKQKEAEKFEKEEQKKYEKRIVKKNNKKFIISLTTFPKRIQTVHFVIRSLLEQEYMAQEIQLWLGVDEFPSKTWLPKKLLELERFGLKIKFTKKTFNQYDKFFHNYELNDELPFVIVDDDVIYPPESMKCLIDSSLEMPNTVIANRAHLMTYDENGDLKNYSEWIKEYYSKDPMHEIFPTGAGGVLYPKNFFKNTGAINLPLVLRKTPYADDIWLKYCSLNSNIKAFATNLSQANKWYERYTDSMQEGALFEINTHLGLNDMQLRQLNFKNYVN